MDEIRSYLQGLLQYAQTNGANLNAESQQALAQLIAQFLEIIQQQEPTQPIGQGPIPDQIQPGGPSSNVEGFAYDPKTNRLLVRFLGQHPNRNGPIYGYDKVPPQIFDLLRKGAVPARTDGKNKWGKWWKGKVPSLGASLFTLIKEGGYNYKRLS